MRPHVPLIVAAALAAAIFAPLACGGGGGSGGAGGSAPVACEGLIGQGECGDCATAHCCQQLEDCAATGSCLACASGTETAPEKCNVEATAAAFNALTTCIADQCAAPCDVPKPACDAPAAPPSMGACFAMTPAGDAGTSCNPITNDGCAAGSACDLDGKGGFKCYPPPASKELCEQCASGSYCKAGMTCIDRCARYCCDDGDCGTGTCDLTILGQPVVGVCIEKTDGG